MRKTYIITLLSTTIISVILLITLSTFIDPLNKLRANTSSYFSSERNLKARMIENNNYKGLLIGSSKVSYINSRDNEKILNAGFSAALPEEILSFLEEKNPNVEWIALGLDYYMFHEKKFPYSNQNFHFQKLNFFEKFSYTISLNTFFYTIKSLVYKLLDRPIQYTHSGSRNVEYKLLDEHNKSYDYTATLENLKDRFKDYKISEKRLIDMSRIQTWADNKGITLIVYLNPYNDEVLKLLNSYNNNEIRNLAPLLSSIFHNFSDLSKNYPDKKYYYKNDPYHFYPIIGDAIINETILKSLNN
jgi:hypothetical protein